VTTLVIRHGRRGLRSFHLRNLSCFNENVVLVSARALLVCSEEERPVVRKSWRERPSGRRLLRSSSWAAVTRMVESVLGRFSVLAVCDQVAKRTSRGRVSQAALSGGNQALEALGVIYVGQIGEAG